IQPQWGTVTGPTSGASTHAAACGGQDAPDHVYAWTPTVSGTAIAETCGAATKFDTVIYAGQALDGSGQTACNDDASECVIDGGGSHGSRITLNVTAGQTYYLFVDGWRTSSGAYALTVHAPQP